jgi:hypothetical protein
VNERQPVDITAPVLVAAGVLLLAVGLAFRLGVIPRALAAAAAAALALVVLLLVLSVVELIDSRLQVGWTSDHLPEWWRHPNVPIIALCAGVVIGYFFW